jgi:transposase
MKTSTSPNNTGTIVAIDLGKYKSVACAYTGDRATAQVLAECGPAELWRGLLDLALIEYHQVAELLDHADKRLDELGQQSQNTRLLDTMPGLGPRTAEAPGAYLHDPGRFHRTPLVRAIG